jgi:hypothetical protein
MIEYYIRESKCLIASITPKIKIKSDLDPKVLYNSRNPLSAEMAKVKMSRQSPS